MFHKFLNKLKIFIFFFYSFILIKAETIKLTDIRFWSDPENIRIVFDITGKPEYEVEQYKNPSYIIVKFYNTKLALKNPEIIINNETLKKIVAEQKESTLVEVYLYIIQEIKFHSFFLKKYLTKPERVVIDCERITKTEKTEEYLPEIKAKKKIIVIDPGHGGEDPGAIGRILKTKEKDITLEIAKNLKELINQQNNLYAFLTREDDYFIPLRKRREIAKNYQADLFISIHTNANGSSLKKGTSIYTLSLKGISDEASLILANRENAADLIGGVESEEKENEDSNILIKILLDLIQTDTLNKSISLANLIIKELACIDKVENLGVKYANFVVLRSEEIPSILIETAHISNKEEEYLLRNAEFQRQIASKILIGILNYFKSEGSFSFAKE